MFNVYSVINLGLINCCYLTLSILPSTQIFLYVSRDGEDLLAEIDSQSINDSISDETAGHTEQRDVSVRNTYLCLFLMLFKIYEVRFGGIFNALIE